jgi:hypothetical protein
VSELINIVVLTKEQLLSANEEAMLNEYSCYCKHDELRDFLREGNKHPVTAIAFDDDGNLVCRILIGPEEVVFVALTQTRVNNLLTVPVDIQLIAAMAEAAETTIN